MRSAPSSVLLLPGLILVISGGLSSCSYRNFHEVDAGRLFRSAQLDPGALAEVLLRHKIRTVINLRGESIEKDWYCSELEVCQQLGVQHHDISMSSRRLPHKQDLWRLLDLFRECPRPILIHCQGGADRTGLAAALYAIEYMGYSKQQALELLGFRYYHVPALAPSKRYFLEIYQGEDWAYRIYDPCQQDYPYYDRDRYCDESEPRHGY